MAALTELLGATVLNGKGDEVPVESLSGKGKTVGIYFSAHWCPPCRAFTPKLAEYYSNFKQTGRAGEMEIIFVSFDRDEKAFKEYFDTMPWLAVNWNDDERKKELGEKFGVSGIPALVIVDGETGALITKNGREKVSEDASGASWPKTGK